MSLCRFGDCSLVLVYWLFCLGLLLRVPLIAPPAKFRFYFAAHEDDWQLFMNPAAFEDVSGAASKTVRASRLLCRLRQRQVAAKPMGNSAT